MSQHILGMEPDSVAHQLVRNHLRRKPPGLNLDASDCVYLMMEFNKYLVEINETLQKLVMDKVNTSLPLPITVDIHGDPK